MTRLLVIPIRVRVSDPSARDSHLGLGSGLVTRLLVIPQQSGRGLIEDAPEERNGEVQRALLVA